MKTQHAALAFGVAILLPGCSSSTPDTPAISKPAASVPQLSHNIQPTVSPSAPLPPPPSQNAPTNYNNNRYGGYSTQTTSPSNTQSSQQNQGTSSTNTSPVANVDQQGSRDAERLNDFDNRTQADQERRQEQDSSRSAEIQNRFDNDVRQQKLRDFQNERQDVIESNRTDSTKKLNLDSIDDRQRRMMRNP